MAVGRAGASAGWKRGLVTDVDDRLHRLLGGPGAALVLAGLVAWTVIPLRLAGRRFARHDL